MASDKEKSPIRVLIVEDHPTTLFGMETLFGREDDVEIVGTALDGQEGIVLAQEEEPDVVVMDLDLPEGKMYGIEAMRHIIRSVPATKVLVVTHYSETTPIVRALGAGAAGYANKASTPEEILEAIRVVSSGQPFLPPMVFSTVRQVLSEVPDDPGLLRRESITDREQEVLDLLVKGKANKEIAEDLMIAVSTVKSHLRSIFDKLGVEDRRDARLVELRERKRDQSDNW